MLRPLLSYIFADQLTREFGALSMGYRGCKNGHNCPREDYIFEQGDVPCLHVDPDSMSDAELYELAANRLDKDRLKAIFIEASKMAGMNPLHIEYEDTIQEYMKYWKDTKFRDIEQTHSDLEKYYDRFSERATGKVDKLWDGDDGESMPCV